MIPIQGHAALAVASIAVVITLVLLYVSLTAERKRRTDTRDDH